MKKNQSGSDEIKTKEFVILIVLVLVIAIFMPLYFWYQGKKQREASLKIEEMSGKNTKDLSKSLEEMAKKAEEAAPAKGDFLPRENLILSFNEFVFLLSSSKATGLEIVNKDDAEDFNLSNLVTEKDIRGGTLDKKNDFLAYSSEEENHRGLFLVRLKDSEKTLLSPSLAGEFYYREIIFSPDSNFLAVEIVSKNNKSTVALFDLKNKVQQKIKTSESANLENVKHFSFTEDNQLLVLNQGAKEEIGLYVSESLEKRASLKKIFKNYFGEKLLPEKAFKAPQGDLIAVLIKEKNQEDQFKSKILFLDAKIEKEFKKIELPFNPENSLEIAWAFEGQGINLTAEGDLYYLAKIDDFSFQNQKIAEDLGGISAVLPQGLLAFEKRFQSQGESLVKVIIYDIIKQKKLFESEPMNFVKLIGIT